MDSGAAVTIQTIVTDAGSIFTFFMTNLSTLVSATPVILIPVALTLIRSSIKNAKSLLFYSKGRRG